jgi:class 3 adenylate cyclase
VTDSSTEPAIPATALIADLRDFTPNLNAARKTPEGFHEFCRFLAGFCATCLDACLLAFPEEQRADPPLYVSSTGDGAYVLIRGADHARRGLLAAILLDAALARTCTAYNRDPRFTGAPGTSYGIGVESGIVHRVSARAASGPSFDTFIGHCVNVAARAEAVTKTLHGANTIVADATIELVAEALFGRTFAALRRREQAAATDADRVAVHGEMARLNQELCISYLNQHVLKGVATPLPLYRLSRSALVLGVARFETLLDKLAANASHLAEIRAALGN